MTITPSVILVDRRHWDCGRWYAVEVTGPDTCCPYCVAASAARKQAEADRLGRVVSALRGALTKARKR